MPQSRTSSLARIAPLAVFCLTAPLSFAQTTTGAVRGSVTDPSGAIVPGARVTVTNIATNVSATVTSDQAGQYSIRNLQIGQYRLVVEAPGFSTARFGPFALEIDQTAKVDVPLAIGSSNTTVEVTDQLQPILQTENATTGETFTQNTINSLPLNGRDFSQLTVFTPGAVSTNFGAFGGQNSTERGTSADNIPNVNGNRQQSNNYRLDGQEINENINNTIGYNPSPDALDQIRVISSNANAEFGNVNGGDVVMVMKSGTNKFHGSVFGFLENYNLDANSWSNGQGGPGATIPKNPFTQTIFGGTIGGPILRDRLFFFADYQAYREHTGGLQYFSVLPAAFRTGNLSAVPTQLYNTQNASGPVPYNGNQVPINNPVARYLFSHPNVYPLPNTATSDPLGIYHNYVGASRSYQRNDQGDFKVDWHLKQSDIISARYSQGIASDAQSTVPIPVQFPIGSDYPDHLFTISETHDFTSAIVNLARASYARIRFNSGVSTDPSGVFGFSGNSLVGIPSQTQQTQGFSQQQIGGGSGNGVADNLGVNPSPEVFIDNVFEYADDLTWQKGRHLLKFGAQVTRYQQNSFYPGNNGELGYFNYTGQFSANPANTTASTVLYPFADFITDNVLEAAVGQVVGRTGQRQYRDAFYAQDDFKLSSNLTLNLGIRYEWNQPIYEVNNKQANLNLTPGLPASQAIQYAGQNGNSRALYNPNWTNIMPRVGFAWQPRTRLVVRGGYGITNYLEGSGANLRLTQNPPFHNDFDTKGVAPSFTGGVYSPGTSLHAANGFPTTIVPVTTFYAWQHDLQSARIQEFTLATEYQLSNTSSLSIGYVGEIGAHLIVPIYANQLFTANSVAPYANVVGQGGVVKVTGSTSSMSYQSLQTTFRQRLTAGLELTANYTYSHSLTDDIGFYGTSNTAQQYYQQNTYDLASEWGPAGSDIRHALSVTGTYAIPYGRGLRYGANSNFFLDELLGGWKISGDNVTYSGLPVTVASPANYSSTVGAFLGSARPDQISPVTIHNRSVAHWFGTDPAMVNACASDQTTTTYPDGTTGPCVYAQQSASHFGNVRPGSLRAPGFLNFDFAFQKSFALYHENRINFRADFFNAFNIASYGNPDNTVSDSSFGQITSTRSTERHIQFELKYAF